MFDYSDPVNRFSTITDRSMTLITSMVPAIPATMMGSVISHEERFNMQKTSYDMSVRSRPPAMTDAICPETLTLMEYISKKF